MLDSRLYYGTNIVTSALFLALIFTKRDVFDADIEVLITGYIMVIVTTFLSEIHIVK